MTYVWYNAEKDELKEWSKLTHLYLKCISAYYGIKHIKYLGAL